ncbi:unnamed protein product [Penicillium camemberti]|uniref:Str. FM013 n=1 Tax=Penicillium camemberti (strain FM 013) TaxID=1429867 RepID=A0A0G4PWX5_PENC3|nr:unnamed protein product [Penicillium camemberti]
MRYEDCPRNHGSACVNCSYGIDEDYVPTEVHHCVPPFQHHQI